jgi:hypothetical protein
MTQREMELKIEILRSISGALGLPESPDRAKLVEALWALHAITPLSGPGEER